MKYIESLIWGFIIALTALILEAFCEIMLKDILGFSTFTFQYTELIFPFSLLVIILVATIEEGLKFIIFWKRILLYAAEKSLTLHGALLGSGFAITEIILAYYKTSDLTLIPFWSIITVTLTHIILGILLINGIAKIQKKYIIIPITSVIILHAIINIAILSLSR